MLIPELGEVTQACDSSTREAKEEELTRPAFPTNKFLSEKERKDKKFKRKVWDSR